MTNQEIIRSWKDEDYLLNLCSRERAFLPENPAGLTELTDQDLLDVDGGSTPVCTAAAVSLVACTPAVKVTFIVTVVVSAVSIAYTLS
ncbi:MAG: mersacidin/lichenicidin family type 2 lantibiotic [Acidobacteria bacterium]|nr:mersacidin/lichenicidin family type 2 lantibiotic [Acidobacteriota bacterium]